MMSDASARQPGRLQMRLPATSANLGSGFDAAAVALDFYLEIEAEPAEKFSIAATGHDAARCATLEHNLILEIYERLLQSNNRPAVPLAIRMANGIPLGMGCGSSAAGRLAAIALANHFGQLGWNSDEILEEACELEGHPDNAVACWLGGFVAAGDSSGRVARNPGSASRSAGDRERARRAARLLLPCRRGGKHSVRGAAGAGLRAGPRRPAAHRHERSHSSALPRAHLCVAATPAASGGTGRHFGRGIERGGSLRAGHRRQ